MLREVDVLKCCLCSDIIALILDYVSFERKILVLQNNLTQINLQRKDIQNQISSLQRFEKIQTIFDDFVALPNLMYFLRKDSFEGTWFMQHRHEIPNLLVVSRGIKYIQPVAKVCPNRWTNEPFCGACPSLSHNPDFKHGLSYTDPHLKIRTKAGYKISRLFPKEIATQNYAFVCNADNDFVCHSWRDGNKERAHVTCQLVAVLKSEIWQKFVRQWNEGLITN